MTLLDAVLLAAAGLAGGVINALAGGGTLITFPALLGIGLPPKLANATSQVALWPGRVTSVLAQLARAPRARPARRGSASRSASSAASSARSC